MEKMDKIQEPMTRPKATPTGEQYLVALIKCAGWVEQPYKELALENLDNIDFLKELYLCACDGVPVEKIREALTKKTPELVLRFLRKKYMEEIAISNSSERLDMIVERTAFLEKEVKEVSEALGRIGGQLPDMEELFPREDTGKPPASLQLPEKEVREYVEKTEDPAPEPDLPGRAKKRGKVFLGWLKDKFQKEIFAKKDISISDYIEELLDGGYSADQLDYLLDCLEDGVMPEEIRSFASPAFPVEIMMRLRSMAEGQKQKKEEKKNV